VRGILPPRVAKTRRVKRGRVWEKTEGPQHLRGTRRLNGKGGASKKKESRRVTLYPGKKIITEPVDLNKLGGCKRGTGMWLLGQFGRNSTPNRKSEPTRAGQKNVFRTLGGKNLSIYIKETEEDAQSIIGKITNVIGKGNIPSSRKTWRQRLQPGRNVTSMLTDGGPNLGTHKNLGTKGTANGQREPAHKGGGGAWVAIKIKRGGSGEKWGVGRVSSGVDCDHEIMVKNCPMEGGSRVGPGSYNVSQSSDSGDWEQRVGEKESKGLHKVDPQEKKSSG